ncbi:MAG TPA: DNA repair protein RecO C-terminal domain-containing protein, partial [Microbacteriaceae bacterium]|nr:DNA repair protein RecO C-terminal domain-containing protein [Microbacteriaceae bacterium]
HERFAAAQGGMVCANCAPPGSPRTDPETIALLLALIRGDWSRVDAAPEAAHNRASGLVAAFAQWQLERGIRSLAHVDRMRRDEQTGSGGPR